MRNRTKVLIAGMMMVTLGVLFGLAGRNDYDDAQKETAHYCDMVRGGFWPDFKGWYQRVCNPLQSAKKSKA